MKTDLISVIAALVLILGTGCSAEHNGRHYAFCCGGCKPSFDKDPAKYAVQ